MEKDSHTSAVEKMQNTMSRYIQRQGRRLNPEGIYCKRHAMQLRDSLIKRASGPEYTLRKVTKRYPDSPYLQHKLGGQYNFHYIVRAIHSDEKYILDPFFGKVVNEEEYIALAYENPEDIKWHDDT